MGNSSGSRTGLEERLTFQLSHETKLKLDQVLATRSRGVSMSDLMREALDSYLDGQADQIGSQQHFNRTMKVRLDQLEIHLTSYLNLIAFMQAQAFAQLAQQLTGDSSRIQASYFMKIGVEGMARDGDKLATQLRMIERQVAAGDKDLRDGTS